MHAQWYFGLGSPAYGDFGIFHEPTGARERAARLDEGLEVLAGLWTGERFSYQGTHFTLDPVRLRPVPVQQPRIPVWVGGVLPAAGPVRRACRWDGMVPLRRSVSPDGGVSLVGPTPADLAEQAPLESIPDVFSWSLAQPVPLLAQGNGPGPD